MLNKALKALIDGAPNKLVCKDCWHMVPRSLQQRLYAAWNDGDETANYYQAEIHTTEDPRGGKHVVARRCTVHGLGVL